VELSFSIHLDLLIALVFEIIRVSADRHGTLVVVAVHLAHVLRWEGHGYRERGMGHKVVAKNVGFLHFGAFGRGKVLVGGMRRDWGGVIQLGRLWQLHSGGLTNRRMS